MILHKNRYEDKWNRIEDTYMNLHSYTHLIFDKATKNIQRRKDSLFNKFAEKSGSLHAEN
jgi:hypothetical protein